MALELKRAERRIAALNVNFGRPNLYDFLPPGMVKVLVIDAGAADICVFVGGIANQVDADPENKYTEAFRVRAHLALCMITIARGHMACRNVIDVKPEKLPLAAREYFRGDAVAAL